MNLIHDYEEMPDLYRFIYFRIRFLTGTDLHKFVSKVLKSINKRKVPYALQGDIPQEFIEYIESGVSKKEIDLIALLLEHKHNGSDIIPQYEDFCHYVTKTKTSTTIEVRKKLKELVLDTPFMYALTKEQVNNIKDLFSSINIEDILKEVDDLVFQEKERLRNSKKEAPLLRNLDIEVRKKLNEISPIILDEFERSKTFFSKTRFYKNNIGFFVTSQIGKDGEVLNEFLKRSNKSTRLMIDLDDENENYFITFSNLDDAAFMESLLYQPFLKGTLEIIKILGIPIQLIISHCQYKDVPLKKINEASINRCGDYPMDLRTGIYKSDSYHKDSIRYVINHLMKETQFDSELYLAAYLYLNYLEPMNTYIDKRKRYLEQINITLNPYEFKAKREEIHQGLLLSGQAKVKWKNELELFKLVSRHYPDAVYQYRTDWLNNQSLDIYIPSLRIGIEYQGQQHYEPIEFFGGKEALAYRQKLDKQKCEKCRDNNVKLIHWHYQDVISKTNLKRKIDENSK
ncbi:hypothetical protein AAGG74_15425 [Bacillus mexicanus]|uniref:hypothetical protein n=1 Tax=Bacillus mexicanus TaxID=2834415 RepID=UPI003D226953